MQHKHKVRLVTQNFQLTSNKYHLDAKIKRHFPQLELTVFQGTST